MNTTTPNSSKANLPTAPDQAKDLCQEGLFVELLPSETASAQVQLFPDGLFSARDGRPANLNGKAQTWQMSPPIAEQLIKLWKLRKSQLCIDYEHQSIFSQQNGQPAPAAGWIKTLSYLPNQGLFAKVYWTPQARNYIKNLEYRYISPTFHFDPNTGAILELVGAGLTNDPGLDGLNAIITKNHLTLGDPMNPSLLAQIRTKLKLPPNLTDAHLQAIGLEFSQLQPANSSQTAVPNQLAGQSIQPTLNQDSFQPNSGQPSIQQNNAIPTDIQPNNMILADIQPNLATPKLSSREDFSNLDLFLNQCNTLAAQILELQNRLAILEQASSDPINTALHEGKLLKNQESWARELQQSHPEMLRRYLSTSQPIQALRTMQTKHHAPATAALTETELSICRMCGLTEAEFIAAKSQGV